MQEFNIGVLRRSPVPVVLRMERGQGVHGGGASGRTPLAPAVRFWRWCLLAAVRATGSRAPPSGPHTSTSVCGLCLQWTEKLVNEKLTFPGWCSGGRWHSQPTLRMRRPNASSEAAGAARWAS